MPADSHPNLNFTNWLRRLEDEIGHELEGEFYTFAAKMYERGLPWSTVAKMVMS